MNLILLFSEAKIEFRGQCLISRVEPDRVKEKKENLERTQKSIDLNRSGIFSVNIITVVYNDNCPRLLPPVVLNYKPQLD